MNLIVDINNAFYKSFFVYKNMYKEEKINEKLLFNKFMTDFMFSMRLFVEQHTIDRIIVCYDSETSFRKVLYPLYKSNRTKQDESFYNVLNYSKGWFERSGFIVTQIEGIEADDCIGGWVKYLSEGIIYPKMVPSLEVNIVLSADEDCRQTLNRNTAIYNNNSKDKRFYHNSEGRDFSGITVNDKFKDSKIFNLDPNFVLFSKMILGCDSDMVPKLLKGRVGEKTLQKKIFDKISFDKDDITDENLIQISEKINSTFKEEQVLISELDRNLALVNLCSDKYWPDESKVLFQKHVEDKKFTYKGNYNFDPFNN